MDRLRYQYAALLLSMGGPGSLEEVEDYIYSLLADPDMIKLPLAGLLQQPLARLIARRRFPKVQERYRKIGGKSPLPEITARQTTLLEEKCRLPVEYAMRYTPPRVSAALSNLAKHEVQRLIVIPLYPQYSTVSTLSAVKDFKRSVSCEPAYRVIARHSADGGFIQAMQARLHDTLQGARAGLRTHVLFTAHSIPEAYIKRGDPYAAEVEETAALIRPALPAGLSSSLAYQSQVGPVRWRGPALPQELRRLAQKGVEQLVVQPLSFVAENLETLYDLDIEFKAACAQAGIRKFLRVPALGESPLYIAALAELIRREIAAWEASDA